MELQHSRTDTRQTGRDNLIIYVRPRSSTCVVKLLGELDLASAEAFEREVEELLDSDVETLLIDLSGLEFVDSTGLQSMLKLTRESAAEGKLRFTGAGGQVEQVLGLTGLGETLPFV